MTIAYFDCFAGAAGDMIVGALLDAGASLEALRQELGKLGLGGYSLDAQTVRRGSLTGLKFSVDVQAQDQHRHLADILAMIAGSQLPPRVIDRASRIFTTLGKAEAKVHRVELQQVHFHEVGAVDSIVDIVGACLCLEQLDVAEVFCSPIPAGSGTIQCEHGVMPVPSPATAQMLLGAKVAPSPMEGELTTPTAAAVLTTLAKSFGPLPPMQPSSVGYGAGSRDGDIVPNLLRVFIGQGDEDGSADSVVEVSANVDDCSGQVVGAALGELMESNCLDAWASPIYMKKNRPAWMISALCLPADVRRAEDILFAQTTTFGIRRRTCTRTKLHRIHKTVETAYGPIRVKVGSLDGKVMTAAPEFSDCLSAAQSHHASVKEVLQAALEAYRMDKGQ